MENLQRKRDLGQLRDNSYLLVRHQTLSSLWERICRAFHYKQRTQILHLMSESPMHVIANIVEIKATKFQNDQITKN
jgi:hypothetical protein